MATIAEPIELAYVRLTAPRPSILLRFPHGLGDCVQFSVVLQHLRKKHPRWDIDVQVGHGKGSMLRHLCRTAYEGDAQGEGYTLDRFVTFNEPHQSFRRHPSTKSEHILKSLFGIEPEPELCSYSLTWGDAERRTAAEFIASRGLAGQRFALVHYQGNSAQRNKNLNEQIVAQCCARMLAGGVVPVILDLDGRSKISRPGVVLCRDYAKDGAAIAALASKAWLNVGIDSGPGHIFQCRELSHVPAVIVWGRHHPVNYAGLAKHVVHVVPHDHVAHVYGDKEAGLGYLQQNYRVVVARSHYRQVLPEVIEQAATRQLTPDSAGDVVRGTEYDAAPVIDLIAEGGIAPAALLHAGVGQPPHCEAEQFVARWPNMKCWGWEPNGETRSLRKTYPGEVRPRGLWSRAGTLDLLYEAGLGQTSFLEPADPASGAVPAVSGRAKVPVETLDSWAGLVGWRRWLRRPEFRRAVLWADVEGAELHVLEGAWRLFAAGRIGWVYLEVGEQTRRQGEATFEELDHWLRLRGFRVAGEVRTGAMRNVLWGREVGELQPDLAQLAASEEAIRQGRTLSTEEFARATYGDDAPRSGGAG